jgi:hypothetical protein
MLICFQGKLGWGVGNHWYGGIQIFIPAMLGHVGKGSLEIKLLHMCYPDPCKCSFVSKANLFGLWELNGMGLMKTFIPAMLGQVEHCSLDIKLLQMCYLEHCECACVSRGNLFGLWELNGMGLIKTCIPAMLGQVGNCSLQIKLLQMCYLEPCECSFVSKTVMCYLEPCVLL